MRRRYVFERSSRRVQRAAAVVHTVRRQGGARCEGCWCSRWWARSCSRSRRAVATTTVGPARVPRRRRRSRAASRAKRRASSGPASRADTIKVAVPLVDFGCIEDFVDDVRIDQDKIYEAYFDDINENGGINGRMIEPLFKTYCPIPGSEPSSLSICTAATEDDDVFAIMGIFVDFTGDAQLCVTRDHERVLDHPRRVASLDRRSAARPAAHARHHGRAPDRRDRLVARK